MSHMNPLSVVALALVFLSMGDTALACCCKNEHDFSFYARQSTNVYLADFISEKSVKTKAGTEDRLTVRPTEILMGEKFPRENRTLAEDTESNCIFDKKPGGKMLVFEREGNYLAIGENTSTVQLHKFVGSRNKQKNLEPIEDKLAEIYFQKIERLLGQKKYSSAKKLLTGWTVNNNGGESLRLAYLAETAFAQNKTVEGDEYLAAAESLNRSHPHQSYLNLFRSIEKRETDISNRAANFGKDIACNDTSRALYLQRLNKLKPEKEEDLDKAKKLLTRIDLPVFYDDKARVRLSKEVLLTLPRGVWMVFDDETALNKSEKAAGEWSGEFLNVLHQVLPGAVLKAHIEGQEIRKGSKRSGGLVAGADGDPIVDSRSNPVEMVCSPGDEYESWKSDAVGRVYVSPSSLIDEINLRMKKSAVCRSSINYCVLDSKEVGSVGSGKAGSEFKVTLKITYGDYSDEAYMYFVEKKVKEEFVIAVSTRRRSNSNLSEIIARGISPL